ncbi:hypothetical protein AMJ85_06740 [candidate division BRC1 bacterium SM23_51]|nr:MAG: hypothetical protein AMJ85_06740 [candidate division BRC1 bacterium SM23_51]
MTTDCKRSTAGCLSTLFVSAAMILASVTAVRAQTSPSAQQAEIERLKIIIEIKQERIEALERELASYREVRKAGRDRKIAAEIQSEVERLRGLTAKRPVETAPLTPEVLERLLDEAISDRYTEEQFRGWETMLKHLGLVPAEMQLRQFLRTLYSEQLAGLYNDKTKKLYVSDKFDFNSTIGKIILAHEICHALQDQHFDLTSSPLYLKTNDDRALAALSVVEGDAMLVMGEYWRENPSWRLLLELPRLLMMDQQQIACAPDFLTHSLLFPYMQGMTFITDCAVARRDWGPSIMQYVVKPGEIEWEDTWFRVRNYLLQNYPRSTEQIIHPEKYYGANPDEPTDIALDALTTDGLIPSENRYNNVAGEFGIRSLLGEGLPVREAETAAAGWDGDRLVSGGQLDGAYAIAWLSVWDSPRDAREFADALARFFKAQRPELVEQTADPADNVWLADKRGSIAIARDEIRVAFVQATDREHAERILETLLSVEVQLVP